MQFFVGDRGPFTTDELAAMVADGTLLGSTEVRKNGEEQPQEARVLVPELFGKEAASARALPPKTTIAMAAIVVMAVGVLFLRSSSSTSGESEALLALMPSEPSRIEVTHPTLAEREYPQLRWGSVGRRECSGVSMVTLISLIRMILSSGVDATDELERLAQPDPGGLDCHRRTMEAMDGGAHIEFDGSRVDVVRGEEGSVVAPPGSTTHRFDGHVGWCMGDPADPEMCLSNREAVAYVDGWALIGQAREMEPRVAAWGRELETMDQQLGAQLIAALEPGVSAYMEFGSDIGLRRLMERICSSGSEFVQGVACGPRPRTPAFELVTRNVRAAAWQGRELIDSDGAVSSTLRLVARDDDDAGLVLEQLGALRQNWADEMAQGRDRELESREEMWPGGTDGAGLLYDIAQRAVQESVFERDGNMVVWTFATELTSDERQRVDALRRQNLERARHVANIIDAHAAGNVAADEDVAALLGESAAASVRAAANRQ